MEDNMIMWKKKHMEAKGTFTSWFFSFTPTNKYKCSPWKCHWGFGLAATLRTNEQNNITQVDREGEHMLISEQKKPKLQAKVGFHFYCCSMGGKIADLQSIPASIPTWTLCLKHRFTSFNCLAVVMCLLGLDILAPTASPFGISRMLLLKYCTYPKPAVLCEDRAQNVSCLRFMGSNVLNGTLQKDFHSKGSVLYIQYIYKLTRNLNNCIILSS